MVAYGKYLVESDLNWNENQIYVKKNGHQVMAITYMALWARWAKNEIIPWFMVFSPSFFDSLSARPDIPSEGKIIFQST